MLGFGILEATLPAQRPASRRGGPPNDRASSVDESDTLEIQIGDDDE